MMNYIKNILLAILLLFSYPLWAQSEFNYMLSRDYSITIYGKASLHNWSEAVGKADGIGAVYWNDDGSIDLNELDLMMEVRSFISSGGPVMDTRTYKMLKSDQHPMITFKLVSPVKSIPADGKGHMVEASGMLTIAGVTRQVILHVKTVVNKQGEITFEGSQLINISDFKIDPPDALFGVLKVADEVSIQFKTNLVKGNNQ